MVAVMAIIRLRNPDDEPQQPGQAPMDGLASVAAPPPAEIDVSNLSVVFDSPKGQVFGVDRASFSVSRGEFICVVGPSGCGKSTVLRVRTQLSQYATRAAR